MSQTAQAPILVYTEATPNPQTLKFVLNKVLLPTDHADFPSEEEAQHSPLATELFGFPFVKGVFIANNFVTITKDEETMWQEVMTPLRDFIREYVISGKTVIADSFWQNRPSSSDADSLEEKIQNVLEKYVKPAVEMDGGAITFQSFDEGIVRLQLKGACSGCPSSMVTLKAGIEGLLKRMVPEVQSVQAEEA